MKLFRRHRETKPVEPAPSPYEMPEEARATVDFVNGVFAMLKRGDYREPVELVLDEAGCARIEGAPPEVWTRARSATGGALSRGEPRAPAPSCVPYWRVLNRLKIMADLNPIPYPVDKEGVIRIAWRCDPPVRSRVRLFVAAGDGQATVQLIDPGGPLPCSGDARDTP